MSTLDPFTAGFKSRECGEPIEANPHYAGWWSNKWRDGWRLADTLIIAQAKLRDALVMMNSKRTFA